MAGPAPTGDALADYLRGQATEFLRALRLHRETGSGANGSESSVDAARALRRSARRISASLHTFQSLLDTDWSEGMRPELAWVSGTLAMEHAYTSRLERLLAALHRLSGTDPTGVTRANSAGARVPTQLRAPVPTKLRAAGPTQLRARVRTQLRARAPTQLRAPVPTKLRARAPTQLRARVPTKLRAVVPLGRHGWAMGVPPARAQPRAWGGTPRRRAAKPPTSAPERGNLTVGAAKAGALLDRQLTLARTRAHSTALQAMGSSRFHAIADKVAVLASEVPLTKTATTTDLRPLALAAHDRLSDAVTALPLITAGHPYNATALMHGLSPDTVPHPQDAPWHQVRLLLRLHRYAREVVQNQPDGPVDLRLLSAGQALNQHRDASEAAAAAAQAARTPRIAPATAYALGVLHADQRHEVEAARFAFQQCWQKETLNTS
ncbi:CHAD domain-containing protein [Streptomyces tuirus]|uniref:CHAD domain-containing protein n=1 Tax=Streptomyces tuirus TaxID=68278 RepID=A0A941FIY7_9ACTN|nr:CHAD domain-containing protein [Streptomyces tuirus]